MQLGHRASRISRRIRAVGVRPSACIALLPVALALAARPETARADTLFKPEGTCTRSYIYRNRTFPVDSSRKLDGEGLRPVLRSIPGSETFLNRYQSGLKTTRVPAYFGSVGLLLAIGGPLYAGTMESPIASHDVKYVTLISGVSILLGSYVFGKIVIRGNEKNLEKAVQTYNDSVNKTEQIQVGLTPLPTGDGGQIKTIVPFQF